MRQNKYKLKKYYSCTLYVILLLSVMFTGCEDDSDLDLSLAVNSNAVKVSAAGGETHIMVYSTDVWHAEFETPVDWASLNKIEEEGNSSILFSYARNFGAARKVIINIKKGEEEQQISIVQEGVSPVLKFPVTKSVIPRTSLPVRYVLDTNLKHNIGNIEMDILYDDEVSEQWISEPKLTAESFEFHALENNLGETRSARVTLKFVDGLDAVYTTFIDITQSEDVAVISAIEPETNLSKFAASPTITFDGNMHTSLYFFQQNINYVDGAGDWISNFRIMEDAVKFDVARNDSGADRSAEITFSLRVNDQLYTVQHIVNQSKE